MSKSYVVAILGATGAVGTRMVDQLAESDIQVSKLKLLASARSVGKKMGFRGQSLTVQAATPDSFNGVDIVLASAGGQVSARLLPEAVKRGAVCIDNTSYFRMNDHVPLIVPEVNVDQIQNHHGIIANPNCSTIEMVVALNPVRVKYGLKQIIVSTYQSAGGAGQAGIKELYREAKAYLNNEPVKSEILPVKGGKRHYPIAFNLLPQIDVFENSDYTHEEQKMIHETKKIMCGDKNSTELKITATCVRVPIPIAHGETVYFTTEMTPSSDDIRRTLTKAPGVVVQDDPQHQVYPQPVNVIGSDATFVGRVRSDMENQRAYHMWVVADNLIKGAAGNAVQIAEELINQGAVHESKASAVLFE